MKMKVISTVLAAVILLCFGLGFVFASDSADTRTKITQYTYSESWRGVSPVDVALYPNQAFILKNISVDVGPEFDRCQSVSMTCAIDETANGYALNGFVCVDWISTEGEGDDGYVNGTYCSLYHNVPLPTSAYVTGTGGEKIYVDSPKSPILFVVPEAYFSLLGPTSEVVICNADYPDGAITADLTGCAPTEGEGAEEGEGESTEGEDIYINLDSGLGASYDGTLATIPPDYMTGIVSVIGGTINGLPGSQGGNMVNMPAMWMKGDKIEVLWNDDNSRPLSVNFIWEQPK